MAVPTVAVVKPRRGRAAGRDRRCPGTMQPFTDAPIYARTNGYLKKWYVDIGARVTGRPAARGDRHARARSAAAAGARRPRDGRGERAAGADDRRALSRADRRPTRCRGRISTTRTATSRRAKAAVESARANVKRLEQLQAFQPDRRAVRRRDHGAQHRHRRAGRFRQQREGAVPHRRRAPAARLRQRAAGLLAGGTARADGRPDARGVSRAKRFTGKLVRTAESIDVRARGRCSIEIDVDNRNGELLPGSVRPGAPQAADGRRDVRLPVERAHLRGDGLQVATVDASNGVALVSVDTGRDFGETVEIVSGLTGDERVVVNPPDSLTAGQIVRVVAPASRASDQS